MYGGNMTEYIKKDDVIAAIEEICNVDYGSMFSYEAHGAVGDVKRDLINYIIPNLHVFKFKDE
jgi:hypothetical protein